MQRIDNDTEWGKDKYLLLQAGELRSTVEKYDSTLRNKISGSEGWAGASYDSFKQRIETGDNSLVEESDKFLALIEDQVPMSRGWRNIDDVVGALPNVPAFLAGHPQCMRRRVRTMKDSAPLAIYMDLTSSAGISAYDVQKRGIVLLALVRLLVEHRPVELWVGAGLGNYGGKTAGTVAWRVDTAPLDLARAAFHISATVMSRGFGYGLARAVLGTDGCWPFHNYDLHCKTAAQRLQAVFPGQELLYVLPIHLRDEMTTDPVGWLKRTMARYTGQEEAA